MMQLRGEPRGDAAVVDRMNLPRVRRPLVAPGAILLAGLLLSACASLAPEPARPSGIAGRWSLDPAASGDFDAAVTRMLAEHQRKMRMDHRERAVGPDGSEIARGVDGEPGFPPVPDEPPERVRGRLEEALRPPADLLVEVGPGTVSLKAADEPARVFYPGQRVGRIDTGGTARLDAGWSGPEFVVQQKYVSGAARVQRYALQAQGSELLVSLEYTDPFSGSFELRSLYRRK
jgi:hypothetical protein